MAREDFGLFTRGKSGQQSTGCFVKARDSASGGIQLEQQRRALACQRVKRAILPAATTDFHHNGSTPFLGDTAVGH